MSDARLGILASLIAGIVVFHGSLAADREVASVAMEDGGPGGAVAREAGADVDAFLEPWRRLRVAHLIPDHARACIPVAARLPATAAQSELAASLNLVAQTPIGAWLVDRAASGTVLVCHDPNTRLAAYYRAQVRLIGVLARLPEPAKIMFLTHELAHVLQHPQFSNDRRFGPRAMLLMHRVREAAAEAIATRVLWQLREGGHRGIWDHKLRSAYGDIARAFAQTMAEAHGEFAELRATRAAFDQWFEGPGRLRQYDGHMLDHLERAARDRRGLSRPRRFLSDDFLRGIGWHAGATFLPAGTGRGLTDARYAGRLTADNAARLDAMLELIVRRPNALLEDRADFR